MSESGVIGGLRSFLRGGLRPNSPAAFGLGIACAAIALALRLGLGFAGADLVLFAACLPLTFIVATLAGIGAAAVTVLICSAVAWWPLLASGASGLSAAAALAAFLANGAIAIWAGDVLRRTRKELDRNLETASQLNAIVTYSGDAIVGFDLDGNIQSWNLGAERLFGYAADEAIGRPISILVPPERKDEPSRLFPRSSSGELLQFETVRMAKGGRRVDVSVSTGPIRSRFGTIIGVSAIFHDVTERNQRTNHIAFVMRELLHRANNLLSVIQGIARQTARQTRSIEEFERRFSARLQALAQSHETLVRREWRGAMLEDLILTHIEPFADLQRRVEIAGPETLLSPRAVEQIGIALHELSTNAVKHGALSVPGGSVRIEWEIGDRGLPSEHLRLTWRESGHSGFVPPNHEGFGFLVIKKVVPTALGGQATVDIRPTGLSWTLTAPTTNVFGALRDARLTEALKAANTVPISEMNTAPPAGPA